jgi:hypothetical protein
MKKSVTAVVLVLFAIAMTSTVLATLDNQKQFAAKYPDSKALAKCSTCHVKPLPKKDGDHESNPYGADLKKSIDPKDEKKTLQFEKVEKLDSDGDGVSNIDEIKKGTNPGDKNSK